MRSILAALCRREDYLFVFFIGLGLLMTMLFALNLTEKTSIPVYSDQTLGPEEREAWLDVLNGGDSYSFHLVSKEEASKRIREGQAQLAIRLMEDDYRLAAAAEHASLLSVDSYIRQAVMEERQLKQAERLSSEPESFREEVGRSLQQPLLSVRKETPNGEPRIENSMQIQLIFAFTLFFSIFTIGFKVNQMLVDRNSGVWNRMLLSRLSKTEMYLGYMIYSFCIGFGQIMLMLLLMQFVFGVDLGYRYDYMLPFIALFVLTIVSFSMLLVGLVRSAETNYSVISMIAPIMPLLSGAYFPVNGRFMEIAAQVIPLTHAMEAFKGIVLHDYGWVDLAAPAAKLTLIATMCMGIGINLIERRRAL